MGFLDDKIDDVPAYVPTSVKPKIPLGTSELSLLAFYTKDTDSGLILVVEARIDKTSDPNARPGTEVDHAFFFNGTKEWQKERDKGLVVGFLKSLIPSKQATEIRDRFLHRHNAPAGHPTPSRYAVKGIKIYATGSAGKDGWVDVAWSPYETQTNETVKANRARLDAAPAVTPAPAPPPPPPPPPPPAAQTFADDDLPF